MTDEYLAYLSGIYQQDDVAHKYGWTFAHFIGAYESGYYERVKFYENVKEESK